MTVNFFIKYMIEHEEQIFIHPEMNIETAGEATGTDFIWQTVASCEEDDKIEHIGAHPSSFSAHWKGDGESKRVRRRRLRRLNEAVKRAKR